ncbi:putative 2-dehydropantoate 2-reductase [Vibrio methylphosphonaticus]|uniref:putative 2-dehydropantoate 2-reductase n=1 Tax=Vibrio methylphosphonaticus TaxID=2946866 RepID=UPI00202A79C4|nr:putative 2-dehydropantoate 2-reductase [Vibrio methylphosphonaticus]MCL9774818.1 putative 2-dehydropantoate 2-reductase [Vibrio methylphosphonaticus]
MTKKVFAVIGTGAIGGYYGARLHHSGQDVHFLFHSDFAHVREHGLTVDSHYGDFSINSSSLQAYSTSETMPKADVILVAIKTTSNQLLSNLIAPIVKPDTLIVLLQNGIGAEQELCEQLNLPFVAGGLCFICSNKIGPGHIHHIDYGRLTLGAFGAQGLAPVESVASDFRESGVDVDVEERIVDARWKKLLWNVPFNGLSAVLSADTKQIMQCPELVTLAKEVMQEVQAAAKALGTDLPSTLIDTMLSNTAAMKPYQTSMLLDLKNQRALELQYMYKNVLDLAGSHNVDMPKTATLYQQLCFIDPATLS